MLTNGLGQLWRHSTETTLPKPRLRGQFGCLAFACACGVYVYELFAFFSPFTFFFGDLLSFSLLFFLRTLLLLNLRHETIFMISCIFILKK